MTSDKKRRFQNLFGRCILPCNGQLAPQVGEKDLSNQCIYNIISITFILFIGTKKTIHRAT
jgi:hypothetical protein